MSDKNPPGQKAAYDLGIPEQKATEDCTPRDKKPQIMYTPEKNGR